MASNVQLSATAFLPGHHLTLRQTGWGTQHRAWEDEGTDAEDVGQAAPLASGCSLTGHGDSMGWGLDGSAGFQAAQVG